MVDVDNAIELKHLYCKVGSQVLLGDINWTVKVGEHWIVFGMNGSGKTTLLSIISGFNNYSKGLLRVFGEEFTAENILSLRKRIGWVSSSFFDKCYRNETVLDIVLSGLTGTLGVAGMTSDYDVHKALQLLSELNVGDKAGVAFSALSKGERQNVLIARAMIATVYKGNIIKNLIMDCQSYTKYRPNETTGGI
ncbi:MAG: ATP-binding cassette domain-containing protein, partial [Peptococcaceae bacterium]|nr:ATP-binding cassette domain-containing protein [Peptococcaceae bacterium]